MAKSLKDRSHKAEAGMRRLQQLLVFLYPVRWRARYGEEFDALLEQLEPRPGELLNLFAGAIRMHITEWSSSRFAVVFCLVGILAGALGQFAIHDTFLSTVVIGIPSEQKWREAQQKLFSRGVLKTVIEEQNLYPAERLRQPLEDVIEHMREKDLKGDAISPSQAELRFVYPDSAASKRTISALLSRLESDSALLTISRSAVPERIDPNRYILFFTFFGATLLIGCTTAAIAHSSWQTWKTLGLYGLIGGVLAGSASLLVPERYTSHAVLMSRNGNLLRSYKLTDEDIASLVADGTFLASDDNGRIPMEQLVQRFRKNSRIWSHTSPRGTPLLSLQISADSPSAAHRLAQRIISMISERLSGAHPAVEVRESASLPLSHVSLNRLAITAGGLALGMIVGWYRLRFQTPPVPIGQAPQA